ncbi:hypothetical protein FQN54_000355 [Arachnomyces sp. PD_36]|nr:hypothetical protein FQN54_000355 [Arachnomyces sp. PD_36]
MRVIASTVTAALFASTAAAHGAVNSYVIDGKDYPGYEGYNPAGSPDTIQRQWPDYNPIMDVTDSLMTCNGGTSAALSAEVPAGGEVTAVWDQWTHAQGPVMVWMYKCEGDFGACDGLGANWFKIDQMGLNSPPMSGEDWGNGKVMQDLAWTSTIPEKLAPGNYLIRHELLALHQAHTPQFYPECAQIVVTGSGTESPGAEFLTAIPAYATQDDPGVDVDVNSGATEYVCPGPEVWS